MDKRHLRTSLSVTPAAEALPHTSRVWLTRCLLQVITNLVEFKPKIAHLSPFLAFNVVDPNKGLHINTTCSIVLSPGSNSTLANADLFHICENNDMRFQYEDGKIELSRFYRDPCLGDYPYDSAIAWGHASTNFTTTKTAGGSLRTVTQMHVPITSLS